MPIDESQMHPLFRPTDVRRKQEEDKLKAWKAVFYTLRGLMWKESCKNLRRDGIDRGYLIYNHDGEPVTEDGLTILQYFDEHKSEFNESFDRSFANATLQELVDYTARKFGMNHQQIMQANDQRMAQYRQRETTRPYHGKPTSDPIAEEQNRKQKKQKPDQMPWDDEPPTAPVPAKRK